MRPARAQAVNRFLLLLAAGWVLAAIYFTVVL